MIIVEGPDLAGKSTLCEALFKFAQTDSRYDPMVRHFTKVSHRFDKFWGYKSCIQRDVILDRFHLSHIVYRHMQRELHDLTPFKYALVDAEITRVGGMVIVMNPSPELIKARFNRPEMYTLDQCLEVAKTFRHICDAGRISTASGWYQPKIDYVMHFSSDLDLDDVAMTVLDMWCSRQEALDAVIASRPSELV